MIKMFDEPGKGTTLHMYMWSFLRQIKSFALPLSVYGCMYCSSLKRAIMCICCDRLLESLMRPEVEYTVAITAFWAIEAVYQESFAHCLGEGSETPTELKETCARWGNEGFGQYCQSLQNIANWRLQKASDDELRKAEVALLSVLEHEVEFWNMSRGNV